MLIDYDGEKIIISQLSSAEKYLIEDAITNQTRNGYSYFVPVTFGSIMAMKGLFNTKGTTTELTDAAKQLFADRGDLSKLEEYKERLAKITNIKLLPHQENFICRAVGRDKVFNASEQGLGKTIMTMAWLYLHCDVHNTRTVILCPKSLIRVWEGALREFFGNTLEIHLLTQLEKVPQRAGQVFITNYESFNAIRQDNIGEITTLVCDESTKLKNIVAVMTKNIIKYIKRMYPKNITLLSGTPVGNSIADLYSQLRILGFLPSFVDFKNRYCKMQRLQLRDKAFMKIVGQKNIDQLFNEISKKILWFRATKQELDMPMKYVTKVPLQPDDAFRAMYNSIGKRDPHDALSSAMTQSLRRHQLCGGFVDGVWVGTPKFAWTIEMIRQCATNRENIVVWCKYVAELEKIRGELVQYTNLQPFVISGRTPEKERNAIVETFSKSTYDIRILIVQSDAMCYGHNLQHYCHTNIIYSQTWSYIVTEQANDRTHRIGQSQNVLVYVPVIEGTVDEDIYNALQKKQNYAEGLGGSTNI